MTYVGRFAPSPTGDLHWGSLFAALASWLEARAVGGRWLLRIEDIDPPRAVPGASATQLHTLHRLGLNPDADPWRQSARSEAYATALRKLTTAGHAYPCTCTRADLETYAGIHLPHCVRPVRADTAQAWRLRVPAGMIAFDDRLQGPQQQDLRTAVGDFVLHRADGLWAYQLAVVVDDAAQGVTDVVRGADLLDSTPRQILLQRLLHLPTPRYLHVPVLLDASGQSCPNQPPRRRCPTMRCMHCAWRWRCWVRARPPRTRHATLRRCWNMRARTIKLKVCRAPARLLRRNPQPHKPRVNSPPTHRQGTHHDCTHCPGHRRNRRHRNRHRAAPSARRPPRRHQLPRCRQSRGVASENDRRRLSGDPGAR
jgi:glutamyl-Q tRNA(Asp) synthetase